MKMTITAAAALIGLAAAFGPAGTAPAASLPDGTPVIEVGGRDFGGYRSGHRSVGRDFRRRGSGREFGRRGPHVHIERFIPQALLLPKCDAVVCHAGYGTTIGALAAGVPIVGVPIGADQPMHAARCEALGAGLVVDHLRAGPEELREAVLRVLEEPSFSTAAGAHAAELEALPKLDYAVDLLEEIAAS